MIAYRQKTIISPSRTDANSIISPRYIKTKVSGRRLIGRNVQCTNISPGHTCLGLEMGWYQFFCKIGTISKKINLVSVYSWHCRQVGLYNKRLPHGKFSSVRFYRAMHYSANHGIEIACCLSVCLSVCNVAESGAHRLEIWKTNCTDN